MAARRERALVRYHGGKFLIAPWIIDLLPPHEGYTEGFGGGGSILLRKQRCRFEIYNDLDGTIVHLFRVLQDPEQSAELLRLLELTPYARAEFDLAYEKTADPVERARRTLIRSFMGFGSDGTAGVYKTGFRANVTSSIKSPAGEWSTYPLALRRIIARLRTVVIENTDAFELLPRYDAPHVLHFVDPPYLPTTRSAGNRRRGQGYHVYEHELTEDDHIRLIAMLHELSGMVALCGYPSELYDDLLAGWERHERKAFADGGRERTEVIWFNALASEARHHGPLFGGALEGQGLERECREIREAAQPGQDGLAAI